MCNDLSWLEKGKGKRGVAFNWINKADFFTTTKVSTPENHQIQKSNEMEKSRRSRTTKLDQTKGKMWKKKESPKNCEKNEPLQLFLLFCKDIELMIPYQTWNK